jgi:hypothetical protein
MSLCSRIVSGSARSIAIAFILIVVPLASMSSTWAGVSFDVSAGLPIGDDAKLFLNITNEYYAPSPQVATMVVQRCPRPEDDYPAILFIAQASGRPPAEILDLRLRGDSWSAIMVRERVSPSVLFVGMDRDPGPPYGHAWGYWRKHPGGRFAIEDRDFVELTKLQVTSKYYRVSPYTVAAERQRGVSVEHYAADRHRSREHAEHGDDHRRHDEGQGHGPHHEDGGPKGHENHSGHEDHSGKPHGNPHDHHDH